MVSKQNKGKMLTSVQTLKNAHNNVWYKLSDGNYIYSGNVGIHNTEKWDSGKITTAPTCQKTGVKTFTCTICGKTRTEVVAKVGHQYGSDHMCKFGCGNFDPKSVSVTSNAKNTLCVVESGAPIRKGPYDTCAVVSKQNKNKILTSVQTLKNAYKNVWYKLSDGNYIYEENVVVHNSEKWNTGKVTEAPTCQKTGIKTYTCTVCGKTRTEVLPKTGHSYGSDFMCKYGCGNYNPSSVKTVSSAANKLYVTSANSIAYSGPYTKCREVIGYKKGAMLNAVSTVKNGYGSIWYKLDNGNYIVNSNVAVHNTHTWNGGTVTVSPTCMKEGKKVFTCTLCGHSETRTLGKVSHKYGSGFMCVYGCGNYDPDSVTAISGEQNKLYVITDGAAAYSGPYTSCARKATYSAGKEITSVSTVKNGFKSVWYKLSGGNFIASADVVIHNEHKWDSGSVTRSATCTAEGSKTCTCQICGKTEVRKIPKLAHKFGSNHLCAYGCGTFDPDSVTEVSAEKISLYVEKSSIKAYSGPYTKCAEKATYKKGKMLTAVSSVKNGYGSTWYKLDDGSYVSNADVVVHKTHEWADTEITKPATCMEEGAGTRKCKICGKTEEVAIEMCEHDFGTNFMCKYGCGNFDPDSVEILSEETIPLRIANDTVYAYSGPYTKCALTATYKRWTSVTAVATVKNGYGSVWYLLDNGKYVSRADVKAQ